MSKRRLLVLSIFSATLAAQACLVVGCSTDDATSLDQPETDAAADAITRDGAAADSKAPADASASDATTAADGSFDATRFDASDDGPADANGVNDASDQDASDAGADANDASAEDAGPDAAADSGSDAAVDGGPAPTVVSTSPAAGDTGVAKQPSIVVTFSEAMDPTTITTNTADTTCSGSLQLSTDAFATCVPMSATPASSNGATVFTVTPAAALHSTAMYAIRVTTSAASATSVALASTFTTATSFTVRYFHTITIDGVNDFATNEALATTSTGFTGYLAWDDTYLYVGVSGSDVASNDSAKYILVYVGGATGTTAGVSYNTQEPALPFAAGYHVRWRADNGFTDALAWSGTAWTEASWDFTGDVYQLGTYFEMRIPLTSIGSPTSTAVHVSMINSTAFAEGTFSGVPSTSFTDGYNPAYGKYLKLGLQGSTAPNASPVLP